MSVFKQSDMQYNYRWTARPEDNPNYRKGADYHELNRSEGYEMLYAINNYLNKKGLVSASSGQKAERLIKEKLPSHTYTHTELYRWLDNNW